MSELLPLTMLQQMLASLAKRIVKWIITSSKDGKKIALIQHVIAIFSLSFENLMLEIL